MAIKQLIKKDGVPFEVVNSKPTMELKDAEDILNGKKVQKVIQICMNY